MSYTRLVFEPYIAIHVPIFVGDFLFRGAENRTRSTCSQSKRTTGILHPEKEDLLTARNSASHFHAKHIDTRHRILAHFRPILVLQWSDELVDEAGGDGIGEIGGFGGDIAREELGETCASLSL